MVIKSRAAYRRGDLHTKISLGGMHNGDKTTASLYLPGSIPEEQIADRLKEKGLDHLVVRKVREVYLKKDRPQVPGSVSSILGQTAGKVGGHAGHGQSGVVPYFKG